MSSYSDDVQMMSPTSSRGGSGGGGGGGALNQSSRNLYKSSSNISIASTTSDYQNLPVISPYGDRDISPDLSNVNVSESFSRPLSRNSNTSCLSTTATKDGIEGKRLHRHGPTSYSNNILTNMAQNNLYSSSAGSDMSAAALPVAIPLAGRTPIRPIPVQAPLPVDITPTSSITTTSPPGDQLNAENIELHNSIFRKQVGSHLDSEFQSNSNYSQGSIKTTAAEFDGDTGGNNSFVAIPPEPPITLKEKINLLDTSVVERQDNF
ncbi:hypothetical protein CAAN1_05S04478 [[Candida] anglica]|uniref:Uncharacterized protein n=1 Tax=[Candida] anglica TaxID=148631 RepID=A0ABP0EFK1_9ASCO